MAAELPRRRRSALTLALARWLKAWAERVLEEDAHARSSRRPAPDAPPAHWRQLVEATRRGPPAHWVELVRRTAPWMLEPSHVPGPRAAPPSSSPSRQRPFPAAVPEPEAAPPPRVAPPPRMPSAPRVRPRAPAFLRVPAPAASTSVPAATPAPVPARVAVAEARPDAPTPREPLPVPPWAPSPSPSPPPPAALRKDVRREVRRVARGEILEEARPLTREVPLPPGSPRVPAEASPPERAPEAPASWPEPPPLDASEPEQPQALLREWERRRRLDHEQGAL